MKFLKGLLEEELENSIRIEKSYEDALRSFPRGSLAKKKINGHYYYYLFYRESQGKVKSRYLGKLSEIQVKELEEQIQKRRNYEKLMREAARQIIYLRKVIRVRSI